MAVEAYTGNAGFLLVARRGQHGPYGIPKADGCGNKTAYDSGGYDPAAPAAAVPEPDSQHKEQNQGEYNADGKLGNPNQQTPFFHGSPSLCLSLYRIAGVVSSKIIDQYVKCDQNQKAFLPCHLYETEIHLETVSHF